MQLAMSRRFTKPQHNRYVLFGLDESKYSHAACVYSNCKRYGVRGVYAFLTKYNSFLMV